ncbi:MAG: hypothetical protein GC159_14880 [Phycisphaera sp.]|nr:hypothetical protein [Phycisphaera sp.]
MSDQESQPDATPDSAADHSADDDTNIDAETGAAFVGPDPEDLPAPEPTRQAIAMREAAVAENAAGHGRASRWRRLFDPRAVLRKRIISGILTLVVTTTLAVLTLFYYAGDIQRYRSMARVCSPDKEQQAQGVTYLINHVEDPKVIAHAEAMLDDADDECFDRIVWALGESGVWGSRFERAWPRYLARRVETVKNPKQRTYLALQIGRLLWTRGPHFDDPRLPGAIETLLADEDPNVRLNALSAAAAMPDHALRMKLIGGVLRDKEGEVRRHAWIMMGLLARSGEQPGFPGERSPDAHVQAGAEPSTLQLDDGSDSTPVDVRRAAEWAATHALAHLAGGTPDLPVAPTAPPADAAPAVKRLAELEHTATKSVDSIEFTDDMPLLIRMQAVRVSKSATVDDMLPVFTAEAPTTRDVACLVAMERFSVEECRELAAKLAASFNDHERMAGAILAGLTGAPPAASSTSAAPRPSLSDDPDAAYKVPEPTAADLRWWVNVRVSRGDDWVLKQHYLLTLWMWGEANTQFDPATLLLKSKMPRTTTTLALLQGGRLDGMDWMINPFGEPGVGGPEAFRILLDTLRYHVVLRRYFPDVPDFWFWADADTQRFQVDVIRDWYLLFRPQLKFDATRRMFAANAKSGASS